MKIIFIAGLARSGSTLLDFVIGSKKKVLSLGEIYYTYKKFNESLTSKKFLKKNICSCGLDGNKCPIWSVIFNEWFIQKPKSYKDAYLIVLDIVQKIYGSKTIIIDSSKYVTAMNVFKEINSKVDVVFLHIVKDVRGALISWINRRIQKNEIINLFIYFKLFRRWSIGNKKIENYLLKMNLKYLTISYDKFCLDTKNSLKIVDDFIETDNKGFFQKNLKDSHIFYGNLFRLDLQDFEIKYDNIWFHKSQWLIPYFIMTKIRKQNEFYLNGSKAIKRYR